MLRLLRRIFPQRCQWCDTSRNRPAWDCTTHTVTVCGSSDFDPHRWPDGTGGGLPASPLTVEEFMASEED